MEPDKGQLGDLSEFEILDLGQNAPASAPLSDPPCAPPLHQKNSYWLTLYKKLVQDSVKQVREMIENRTWVPFVVEPTLQMYYIDPMYSHYSFKIVAFMEGIRAERLRYVLMDHDPKTRMQWDADYVKQVALIESFNDDDRIQVVESIVDLGIPLVWSRTFLGIQWYKFDAKTKSYIGIFKTTSSHPTHLPQQRTVLVNGLIGFTIRGACELTLVAYLNPGDSLPKELVNSWRHYLVERVQLYEQVVHNWNKYYSKNST